MAKKATSSGVSKKTFVLDTNVLIHDPKALFNFEEHDVVIPMTVLEELDSLKSGTESKNLSAREVSRTLRKLIDEGSGGPISLGNNLGMISFESAVLSRDDPSLQALSEDSADNRIIATAYNLHKEGKTVILVTKDNNMAVKAYALGIQAEDYKHDMVKDLSCVEEKIKEVDQEDVNHPNEVDLSLYINQPVVVRACSDGSDHIYRWMGEVFTKINRKEIVKTGLKPKNLEQDFAVEILMDEKLSAVALVGSAGSGKTLLTMACAIAQKQSYDRILVARPAVELSDKTLGFLPGTLEEKYDPYLAPIRSACRIIMEKSKSKDKDSDIKKWMNDQDIELLPLSMIRGETFHRSFIVVDESQNLTPNEVKTIVSRAGEGTKIVFTGDINQIDMQYLSKETNGLSHLIDRFRGKEFFAYIEMQKSVRSPLAEAADKML